MRERLSKRAVFGHMVVPFFMALYLALFPLDIAPLHNTSQGYLDFASEHALGYPFFLNIIGLFSQDLWVFTQVQLWLFALSLAFLSIAMRKVSASNWLAILTTATVCLNPLILPYQFSIQPFSLFLTFTLFMTAALIMAVGCAGFFNLLFFGFFMGLSITVLDLGWGFLGLIFFAALLIARQREGRFLKAIMIPVIGLALPVVTETITYGNIHNTEKDSPFASLLFIKASLMESEQSSPYADKDPRTHIWSMIEYDLLPARNKIWQNKDFTSKENLLLETEGRLLDNFALTELQFAQTVLERPLDDVRLDIATSRIIQDPIAFIKICIVHYQGLWESEEWITYVFWFFTLGICLISFWHLLIGSPFNGAFGASFMCAAALQLQSWWVAVTGLGPDNIVVYLSPFLTLSICSLLIAFYVTFINPIHTYD